MCALCEIHGAVHLRLVHSLHMVIFQLKSVKEREKGEFTQIFAYSHFFIFHNKTTN